jgi:hypothetical protein
MDSGFATDVADGSPTEYPNRSFHLQECSVHKGTYAKLVIPLIRNPNLGNLR